MATEKLWVKPRNDRVLVEIDLPPQMINGILMPPNPKTDEYSRKATVLAVGPDVKDLKPGDKVYLPVNRGDEVERFYRARHAADKGQKLLVEQKDITASFDRVSDGCMEKGVIDAMDMTEHEQMTAGKDINLIKV